MTITFTTVLVGILALVLGFLIGMPARSGRSGVKVPRWKRGIGGSRVRRSRVKHGRRGDRTGVHREEELQELERSLGRATTLSHRTRRHFTPIDLLRRAARQTDRRRTRRYFHTAAPSRKPPAGAKEPAAPTRKGNRPPP